MLKNNFEPKNLSAFHLCAKTNRELLKVDCCLLFAEH
jgi:hypothetical protein